jgi:carboxypeptidase C (cathepsin A)
MRECLDEHFEELQVCPSVRFIFCCVASERASSGQRRKTRGCSSCGSAILLKNEKDEPTALLYSTAYTRSDVKDPSTRPIAFVYNGGPGSASVWLHMG